MATIQSDFLMDVNKIVILHYLSAMKDSVQHVLDEDVRLMHTNILLAHCIQLGVLTNAEFTSLEAVQIFLQLLKLYGMEPKGGSPIGKQRNIERKREEAYARLLEDYFSENPTYDSRKFRRRFRMRRHVFDRIVSCIKTADNYFIQKPDATGRLGAHPIQKATAALRMLAYGVSADMLDEWLRLGESTILETLKRFVAAVIDTLGKEYLRAPTNTDTLRLLHHNASRGFPGCLGSIDCWHWAWKNCPAAWKGHYTGKKGTGCITEACCSHDLWIWHLFVGNPGSLNDLNVLDRSPLLHQLYNGTAPKVTFTVNGNTYDVPYWLGDGIYPRLTSFVKAYAKPKTPIDRNFTAWQEATRKDIERAFGVLQGRFGILKNPARHWSKRLLDDIVRCCVILHNMIIEDEYKEPAIFQDLDFDDFDGEIVSSTFRIKVEDGIQDPRASTFAQVLKKVEAIHCSELHFRLRDDLKSHLFEHHEHLA